MYRDFSDASKENLLKLVTEVEGENWCGITDWFGDRWLDFQGWIGQLNINKYLNDVDEYHKKVIDKNNTTKKTIEKIFTDVKYVDTSYKKILYNDFLILNQVYKYLGVLSTIVNPENGMFSTSQIMLTLGSAYGELKEWLDKLISPAYIHDDGVHYGGDQGSARRRWSQGDREELRKIVKKYFPDYSDAQISDLLSEMNSEGCNYMAWVNTIFGQYVGREEEFEKDFGFPMYDENGYPNYDLVMLDFYCTEGEIDGKTYGLTKKTSETRWENYLKSKNLKVDIVNLDVTFDTFDKLSEKGEIVIAISPVKMRNSSGKLVVNIHDAGHAMVITGVEIINGKKMYKVSSWGEAYYIDPDDFDKNMRIEYQQARYNT